jgi:BirA family transcriptional regulator, biotin operon repressor / biotin---[acetyl-CoA-carboxylase] ligase
MPKKLNANFVKVVNILSDGAYHDGSTMGEKLGMTRSAIWKVMKKLEAYQIKVDSIKGKGYAVLEPLILLDANRIKRQLEEKVTLEIFETIGSTNDYLKQAKHSPGIKMCLAEQQTQARGRLNRDWYSPFGMNIYLSCLFTFQKDMSELSGLSLVVALAIVKTLQGYGVSSDLSLKWPNDILYAGKKLSGTLIEIQAETHGHTQAIMGMGINVNMLSDEHHISQAWTSMRKILGLYVDRNELCARLINHLIAYLREFDARGFSVFTEEWMHMDCLTNQTIHLQNANQKIKGKVMGINEQGHLLVKLTDGSVRAFSSGDTSIVKKA